MVAGYAVIKCNWQCAFREAARGCRKVTSDAGRLLTYLPYIVDSSPAYKLTRDGDHHVTEFVAPRGACVMDIIGVYFLHDLVLYSHLIRIIGRHGASSVAQVTSLQADHEGSPTCLNTERRRGNDTSVFGE